MNAWFAQFIASGRASWLAWGALLAGIGSLAWYAYSEHNQRVKAETVSNAGVVMLHRLDAHNQVLIVQRDSLLREVTQLTTAQNATVTNYFLYKLNENQRIQAARAATDTLSGEQLLRQLTARYPDPAATGAHSGR